MNNIKRNSSSSLASLSCPLALKQFLLLVPSDSTFADLNSLVRLQYEKLYKSHSGYLALKKILHFQDANQCDLDEDFLVTDICESNDLVYAVVEFIDQSNKKIKITTTSNNPNNQNNLNQQNHQKSTQNQLTNPPKSQNEKKVPEYKPTPINPPNSHKNNNSNIKSLENVEVKPQPQDDKKPEAKSIEPKFAVDVQKSEILSKVPKEIEINEAENKIALNTKPGDNISHHIQEAESTIQKKINNPVLVNVQKPEVKKREVVLQNDFKNETKVVEPLNMVSNMISEQKIAPKNDIIVENISKVDFSSKIEIIDEPIKSDRSEDIITPGPTPVQAPVIRPTTVFMPRKSTARELVSSDSSDEESENISKNFDAVSLFGSQVIASEPRRSDAFVLFAAGSSSDDEEDSSDKENVVIPRIRTVTPPTKSSSIVSLQAAPSSEIDINTASTSSEDEDDLNILPFQSSETVLPHSVTLRRLSSISPIPDPSEIPSLDELKESLSRAPTPIQLLAEQKNHHNHSSTDSLNNKRGRPKKMSAGRPKKDEF